MAAKKIELIKLKIDLEGLKDFKALTREIVKLDKSTKKAPGAFKSLAQSIKEVTQFTPKTINQFRQKEKVLKKLREEVRINGIGFKRLGREIEANRKKLQSFNQTQPKGGFFGRLKSSKFGVGGRAALGAMAGSMAGNFGATGQMALTGAALGGPAGAAAGAAIGGVIGNNTGDGNTALGAIIGGVVGGAAGAIIGDRMDKQAKEIEQEIPGAEVERVGEGINVTFDESSGVYFDTEKYSDEETQSYVKYPTKDEWVNGFLQKTIENCYRGLKGNKYMLINIANTPKYKFIEEETIRISKELGFKQEKTIELTLSSVMGAGYKYEPIFVFKK